MAKRMTADQKEAVRKFWQTVDGVDRYLASIFVSKDQSAFYVRLLNERAAACAALGVSQDVPTFHGLEAA